IKKLRASAVAILTCTGLLLTTHLAKAEEPAKAEELETFVTDLKEIYGSKIDVSGVGKITTDDSHHCSGTLVSRYIVATAKHCLNLDDGKLGGMWFSLSSYKSKKGKDRFRHRYEVVDYASVKGVDVALLELPESPVEDGAGITPLWAGAANDVPEYVTVMGYSVAHRDGSYNDLESCANVPLRTSTFSFKRSGGPYARKESGQCWAYRDVKQKDGSMKRERVKGSVIHGGASGGPWFATGTDGRVYLYAVHRGAGGYGAIVTESVRKAVDNSSIEWGDKGNCEEGKCNK
ncbi:trypsin-like serine peptidase, partial [Streptomyces sp. NPDC058572]|uniref:trypsin-like serine peptidase n=1 Tax=Streptomyces sp. NPDC058572 TaxID=3346546 RepID=UPI003653EE79